MPVQPSRLLVPFAALLLALTHLPAHAMSWRDITPGTSTRADVVKAFGEPSRSVTTNGQEVIAYFGQQSIQGTKQVQFRLTPESGQIDRIDVFPASVVDRESIESTYGPACSNGAWSIDCYVLKQAEKKRTILRYTGLGLAVFLHPGDKSVHSLTFVSTKPVPALPPMPPPPSTKRKPGTDTKPSKEEPSTPPIARDEPPSWASGDDAPSETSQASGGPSVDDFSEGARLEDPLKIGGELLLRGMGRATGQLEDPTTAFASPNVVEVYLDGRPNDRLRAMVTGRMTYDPTQQETGFLGTTPLVANNPQVVLDQLWLRFDLANTVYVTAGKQKVKWGTARYWSPTDFLSPQRNLLDTFDARLGTTMIKLHVPWESTGWNFYAVGLLDTNGPSSRPLRTGGAARAEIVLGNTEVGLSGVVRDYRKPRAGLDLSSALGLFDVHAEVAVQRGVDAPLYRLMAEPPAGGGFLDRFETYSPEGWLPSASGGFTLTLDLTERSQLNLNGEYFYNSLGYTQPEVLSALILRNRYQPFYAGQQYAAFGVQLALNDGLATDTVGVTTIANISDRSAVTRLDALISVFTNLSVQLYASVPYGRRGGEFRQTFDIPEQTDTDGQTIPALSVPPPLFEAGLGLRLKI